MSNGRSAAATPDSLAYRGYSVWAALVVIVFPPLFGYK
jgi:hypothetical protein